MTARILIFGRNNSLPADAAQSCAHGLHATPAQCSPFRGSAATRQIGGAMVPHADATAWSHISQPRDGSSPARGELARSHNGNAAPLFDATAERWIVRPSSMTEDAVAPAEQGCLVNETLPFSSLRSPAVGPSAVGRLIRDAAEAVAFAAGLTVFGLIAAFFLVLA